MLSNKKSLSTDFQLNIKCIDPSTTPKDNNDSILANAVIDPAYIRSGHLTEEEKKLLTSLIKKELLSKKNPGRCFIGKLAKCTENNAQERYSAHNVDDKKIVLTKEIIRVKNRIYYINNVLGKGSNNTKVCSLEPLAQINKDNKLVFFSKKQADIKMMALFVVKIMELEGNTEENQKSIMNAKREVALIKKVYRDEEADFFSTEDNIFTVITKAEGSSLIQFLIEKPNLTFNERMCLLYSSLNAFMRLHKSGVAHLDGGPMNLMVEDIDSVKVIDFGSAINVDSRLGTINRLSEEECRIITEDIAQIDWQTTHLTVPLQAPFEKSCKTINLENKEKETKFDNLNEMYSIDYYIFAGCIAGLIFTDYRNFLDQNPDRSWVSTPIMSKKMSNPHLLSEITKEEDFLERAFAFEKLQENKLFLTTSESEKKLFDDLIYYLKEMANEKNPKERYTFSILHDVLSEPRFQECIKAGRETLKNDLTKKESDIDEGKIQQYLFLSVKKISSKIKSILADANAPIQFVLDCLPVDDLRINLEKKLLLSICDNKVDNDLSIKSIIENILKEILEELDTIKNTKNRNLTWPFGAKAEVARKKEQWKMMEKLDRIMEQLRKACFLKHLDTRLIQEIEQKFFSHETELHPFYGSNSFFQKKLRLSLSLSEYQIARSTPTPLKSSM